MKLLSDTVAPFLVIFAMYSSVLLLKLYCIRVLYFIYF